MAENEGFQVSGQANNAPDGVTCRVEFRDPHNLDSTGANVLLLTAPVSVSGQRYALDLPQSTTELLPDEIYADLIVIDTAGNKKTKRLLDNGTSILSRRVEGYVPVAVLRATATTGLYGYGRGATGGRGGQIIVVTNTNASGSGSFREAIETVGSRVIIFDVSGELTLEGWVNVGSGDVTVYGQTGRGDGVYLRGTPASLNAAFIIRGSNMIFQHMRFRHGGLDGNGGSADSVSIGNSSDSSAVSNIVFDHCSFSWGVDETFDTAYGANNIVVYRSIISEGLEYGSNNNGTGQQGYLGLIAGNSNNVSLIQNIWSCCHYRAPAIFGANNVDLFNNVIAGYTSHAVTLQAQNGVGVTGNVVDNLFIDSVDVANGNEFLSYANAPPGSAGSISVCVYGNGRQTGFNGSAISTELRMDGVLVEQAAITDSRYLAAEIATDRPVAIPLAQLENALIADCGARRPTRDTVDTRILAELVARDMPLKSVVGGEARTHIRGGTGTNAHLVGTVADVPWPVIADGPSLLGLASDSYVTQSWLIANNHPGGVPDHTDSNGDGLSNFRDYMDYLAN